MDPRIPEKQYFRIGEVAEVVGVEAYVLRFWETEFKSLKPAKSKSNRRMYSRRDVEVALRIRDLLYEEGYTIPGARRKLREKGDVDPPEIPALNLDFDWVYRRLGRRLLAVGRTAIGGTDRAIRHALHRQGLRLLAGLFRHHGPHGILARTWPTGSMVLWVAVLLGAYLVFYYAGTR